MVAETDMPRKLHAASVLAVLLEIAVELERDDRPHDRTPRPQRPQHEIVFMPGRAFIRPVRLN